MGLAEIDTLHAIAFQDHKQDSRGRLASEESLFLTPQISGKTSIIDKRMHRSSDREIMTRARPYRLKEIVPIGALAIVAVLAIAFTLTWFKKRPKDEVSMAKAVITQSSLPCREHSSFTTCERSVAERTFFLQPIWCERRFREPTNIQLCKKNSEEAMILNADALSLENICAENHHVVHGMRCGMIREIRRALEAGRPGDCRSLSSEAANLCKSIFEFVELMREKKDGTPADTDIKQCEERPTTVQKRICLLKLVKSFGAGIICPRTRDERDCFTLTWRGWSPPPCEGPLLPAEKELCQAMAPEVRRMREARDRWLSRYSGARVTGEASRVSSELFKPPNEKAYGDLFEASVRTPSSVKVEAIQLETSPANAAPFNRRLLASDGAIRGLSASATRVSEWFLPWRQGRGIAAADFNNDGWMDLALGWPTGLALFANEGGNRFRRVPPVFGPEPAYLPTFGDFDEDGDMDLLFFMSGRNPKIAWNQSGNFTRVSELPLDTVASPAFFQVQAAALADFNRDSHADIALATTRITPFPDETIDNHIILFINKGGGSFEHQREIPSPMLLNARGLLFPDPLIPPTGEKPGHVDPCDFYVEDGSKNFCKKTGMIAESIDTPSGAFCEQIEGDNERLDCEIMFETEFGTNPLLFPCENLSFEIPRAVEICKRLRGFDLLFTRTFRGMESEDPVVLGHTRRADLDADGRLDLLVSRQSRKNFKPFQVFRNLEGPRFVANAEPLLLDGISVAGTNFVVEDFDNDGDLDVVTYGAPLPIVFIENKVGGNLLQLELVANGSPDRALLSKIEIEDERGTTQVREMNPNGGFMSQQSRMVVFGLGSSKTAKLVKITWPDGHVTRIDGLFWAGHRYRVSRRYNEVSK